MKAAPHLPRGFSQRSFWIEYSIKRDMETGEDAVRVMTVHAAKGSKRKSCSSGYLRRALAAP